MLGNVTAWRVNLGELVRGEERVVLLVTYRRSSPFCRPGQSGFYHRPQRTGEHWWTY